MSKKDIFTSIVRVKGNDRYNVVPIKSSNEVDKELWVEMSKVVSRIYVSTPINRGSVVCKNILNSGVDIICTRDLID